MFALLHYALLFWRECRFLLWMTDGDFSVVPLQGLITMGKLFSPFSIEVLFQPFGQMLPPGEKSNKHRQHQISKTAALLWIKGSQISPICFPHLSRASLYLFNLSASSLFSSIHRCMSSSFSLRACANASFSAFCSVRSAANSLEWHSMVNSKSERVALRLLLPLARVRASWW